MARVSRTERFARLLCAAHLDSLARMSWRGLPILNYHRIGVPDEFDDPDLFSATIDDFDQQVALLAAQFEMIPAGHAELDAKHLARRI